MEEYPQSGRAVSVAGVALAGAAALAVLGAAVVARRPSLVAADTALAHAAHTIAVRHPAVHLASARLTRLGAGRVVLAVLGGTAVVLARRRRWRALSFTVLAPAGAGVLGRAVRGRVARARPERRLRVVSGYAFPSNHATDSAAAALVLVGVSWSRLPPAARPYLLAGASAWPVLVGGSRVLLGVHWPTDVVAGWLVALTVVPAVAALTRPAHGRVGQPRSRWTLHS